MPQPNASSPGTPTRAATPHEIYYQKWLADLEWAAREHEAVYKRAETVAQLVEAQRQHALIQEQIDAQRELEETQNRLKQSLEEKRQAEASAQAAVVAAQQSLEQQRQEPQRPPTQNVAQPGPHAPNQPPAITVTQPSEPTSTEAPSQNAWTTPVPSNYEQSKPEPVTVPTPQPAAPVQQPQVASTSTPINSGSSSDREIVHQRYLDLHKRLKKLRQDVFDAKPPIRSTYQDLKLDTIGDLRREVRKRVTQLTTDIKSNISSIRAVLEILRRAQKMTDIQLVDPTVYFATPPPQSQHIQRQGISALFIYLLSIFSKAIVSKLTHEAAEIDRSAEPVGIAAITVFSNADLRFEGASMIDILLAKYHKACPILFGIGGSETMQNGRLRLGWKRDEDGTWEAEQDFFDRMTGLGAGFGALSLRDFSRAKATNPFPAHHYWTALARIMNTPGDQITRAHCVVVKAMLEVHVEKFIGFYGGAAIAVLGFAVNDFVAKAPRTTESATLATLRGKFKREHLLTL